MADALLSEKDFEFCVNPSEGREFARLSGDFNPLHVDPSSPRTQLFGETIPHGVFILLKALEAAMAEQRGFAIRRLKCRFPKPVRYGQPATCRIRRRNDSSCDLIVEQGDVVMLRATTDFELQPLSSPSTAMVRDESAECRRLTFEESTHVAGKLSLPSMAAADSLLPSLSKRLSSTQLAEICTWTRLIGMECPGYDSIFTSIDVAASDGSLPCSELHYSTSHTNAAMRFVALNIVGPTLGGRLESIVR